MNNPEPYSMHLTPLFKPLELIDVPGVVSGVTEAWYNQTLCQVNDCVIRLGVVEGQFHWHKHDDEDEFFYVVSGRWIIELEGSTVELKPGQAFTIPRGVQHCPRAPEKTVLLMIEGAGVIPTGDV